MCIVEGQGARAVCLLCLQMHHVVLFSCKMAGSIAVGLQMQCALQRMQHDPPMRWQTPTTA